MTANEWKQQTDLLGKAIRGDEHAISEVCEFIDKYRRAAMMNRLSYAGAVCSIDEGYREVLLFVQYKLSRLKIVDAFESWLCRLVMSVAKKYLSRNAAYVKAIQVSQQSCKELRGIGPKAITADVKREIGGIVFLGFQQEEPSRRRLLFVRGTDATLPKMSISNHLNYPHKIHAWVAMANLRKRWATVLFPGYAAVRNAQMTTATMSCMVRLVYKLVQNARQRFRNFLPGYSRIVGVIHESHPWKATRRYGFQRPSYCLISSLAWISQFVWPISRQRSFCKAISEAV